jgi:hypothetical protein
LEGDVLVALLNEVAEMHFGGVLEQHPIVLISGEEPQVQGLVE